ncbi:MAG: hydrogenase formation protein HypD [Anaerolineae bacterium]|nr:hydrogenase formation protein HypD [Anaerolineae bacterium]
MELLKDFRNPDLAKAIIDELHRITTQDWVIMEICGGQTHAIMQYGIDQLLPEQIELVHGPGCPVCVTPLSLIDQALAIAQLPEVIFTSFGDMLRVPGSNGDLFTIRANGGDVRTVYSPLDAVKIAQKHPDKEVVFFAIGFETTAPVNLMAVKQAKNLGLTNFSILVSQSLVPPAMRAILSSPANRVQAFLAAGHVNTIMGLHDYYPIAETYKIPIVVTGFEPLDLLNGILAAVKQLEAGKYGVENAYSRVVTDQGNIGAQQVINDIYEVSDRQWRGIGVIPQSGWELKQEYDQFNAAKKFSTGHIQTKESEICIAGEILQGLKKPYQCPAFGKECTPRTPLGATMVSSEGACAAYYQFARNRSEV